MHIHFLYTTAMSALAAAAQLMPAHKAPANTVPMQRTTAPSETRANALAISNCSSADNALDPAACVVLEAWI